MYFLTHEQWLQAEDMMNRMESLSKIAEKNGIKMICDFSSGIYPAQFYCKLSVMDEPIYKVLIYDVFKESEKEKIEEVIAEATRICNDPSVLKEARVNYYKNKIKELENE